MDAFDFDALYAMFSNPEVMRYYPGMKDQSLTQSWLDWMLDMYERYGHGLFAVEQKSDGQFVGQAGLIIQNVGDEALPEVGYIYLPSAWGKGYATETSIAWRDRAFDHFRYQRIISLISPRNAAAINVAKRVGMSLEREIVKWEVPIGMYSLSVAHRPPAGLHAQMSAPSAP